MVVSKEGKRRRKVSAIAQTGGGSTNPSIGSSTNGPSVAAERDLSPPEIPKRPKVHAQRKFAQGQGTASSSYLSYSSAPPTPGKDSQNRASHSGAGNGTTPTGPGSGSGTETNPPVPELLPNMRPNTDDFLTFLCFRGTPVLPPELDYFNKSTTNAGNSGTSSGSRQSSTAGGSGSSKQKSPHPKPAIPSSTNEAAGSGSASASSSKANPQGDKQTPDKPTESVKQDKLVVQDASSTPAVATSYMPFAVRKRAEQHPAPAEARTDRKRTQDKMQALRKKYHDQRVAKLRATGQGPRQSGRGNVAISTRSSNIHSKATVQEEEEASSENEEQDDGKVEEEDEDQPNKKEVREETTVGRRKSGLRSGAASHASSPVVESVKGASSPAKMPRNAKRDSSKGAADQDETGKDSPAKTADRKTPNKTIKTTSPPDTPTEEASKQGGTRASAANVKKATKETPTIASDTEGKEKRTTRLSALRNPPPAATKSTPEKSPVTGKTSKEKQKPTERVDFSSDDDEPLSRAPRTAAPETGKTTRSGRTRKSEPTATTLEKDPDEMPDKKTRRSESVVSRRSDISSRKSEMHEVPGTAGTGPKKAEEVQKPVQSQRGRKRKEPIVQSQPAAKSTKEEEFNSEAKEPAVAATGRKKRETPAPDSTGRDGTLTPDVEEKKPKTASSTPVESLSTSRPSRKTKEAATLYMELIGRRLNQDDKSDDDASSLDSLELPNVRKMERMENELKANVGKTRDTNTKQAGSAATKGKRKTAQSGNEAKPVEKSANDDEEDKETEKVIEKSFSDSDEEPLASKFQHKQQHAAHGRQPAKAKEGPSPAKQQPTGRKNAKKANVTEDDKSGEDQSTTEKKPTKSEETTPRQQVVAATKKGTVVGAAAAAATLNTPPGTTKQNGTMAAAAPASVLSSGGSVAVRTPTKMNSIAGISSPLESPLTLASDHLKTPSTSEGQNLSRLNKSMDNTILSTVVEPAESPIKIPQMLNIPTIVPSHPPLPFQQASHLTSPTQMHQQQAPFTRAIKPSLGVAADGYHPLDKSPTAGVSQQPDNNMPFNRTTTAPVAASANAATAQNVPKSGDYTHPLDHTDFLKVFDKCGTSDPAGADKPATTAAAVAHSSLLGNLLPSKEESEKIFGIASVSLAQSSGPLDTKCTLGKCGSVHKPPLGPPVLTESLLGGNLSPRDRRKAKVNMTHEQIQKWIYESSWSPIEDDLKDDDLEVIEPTARTSPPPTVTAPASAPTTSTMQTSTPAASGSGWAGMMASTSTPISVPAVGNGRGKEEPDRTPKASPIVPSAAVVDKKGTTPQSGQKEAPIPPPETKPTCNDKDNTAVKSQVDGKPTKEGNASAPTPTPKQKESRKSKAETPTTPTVATQTTAVRAAATTASTTGERKPIYRNAAGRTPVYKQEALSAKPSPSAQTAQAGQNLGSTQSTSKPANQGTSSVHQGLASAQSSSNKFGAFSPVNETSVYSFDKEEDFMPVATPFRRQHGAATAASGGGGGGRRESCNSSARDEPTSGKRDATPVIDEKPAFQKPPVVANKGNNSAIGGSSVANAEEKTKPTEEDEKKEDDKGTAVKQETSDNEADGVGSVGGGQTFYIPLQGPTAGSSTGTGGGGNSGGKPSDQLIQGVAVKLGTEGPDGPNQRVIMHAKLVTKAEMGSNPTTIPDSMNVQELVKSLTAQGGATAAALGKEGLAKLLPMGLLQSRLKSPTGEPIPSPTHEDRASAEPMSRGLSRIASNSSLSSQRSKPTNAKASSAKGGTTVGRGGSCETAPLPQPDNNTVFPRRDDPAQMVEAPVFKPTEKEFHDPMEYIERIAPIASRFGICRIVPPASFKPECRIADDMRFMAYNQYVHKMLHRWGPSAKEYAAIKKYLATQSINLQSPPVIGGMEVDLPRLYHTVQELGGLKEVIEKKKWARVSEDMCIPKAAHDRVSKLDDIYCKYLLPYDTLSPAERQKLFDEVEADWAKREAKARRNADKGVGSEIRNSGDSDEDDSNDEEEEEDEDECSMECIVKGRSMPLNQFFRIARNTMSLWFRNSEPSVAEIEAEYWRHVAVRDSHVCVHSGSIDSSAFGYGFPSPKVKGSSCAKHPWNLKVLTNNSGSILRSLGPVMGITIPTLHVGMLFSACCWYRDPHGLPWIEYLHTGANKIWYGVPDDQNANFRAALTVLVPTHCQNKTIWLPCDTAMVPPHMLTDRNVSLCRTEQQPGQFVVVFPRAYTSSLCTGYAVSESVYFATNSWLDTAKEDFRDIQESCEPTMFSVEQLLFAIANDQRSNHDTLVQAYPMIVDIYEKEKLHRQTLKEQGVTKTERIESKKKSASLDEFECERCRANLYLSLVKVKVTRTDDDDDEDGEDDNVSMDEEERIYCLKHAVKHLIDGGLQQKHCRLAYTYSLDDIEELLKKLQDRIANKKLSKSSAGSSGGGGGAGGSGGGGGGGGGGSGRGKSSLHLASTSSQSSSSYQAPGHSKYAGMATMLK
uniref:ARID domain-containing protein n=1 Tax=Anopheles epiroticus TaxID=199890 RepID=A0A182PP47_9DIPT